MRVSHTQFQRMNQMFLGLVMASCALLSGCANMVSSATSDAVVSAPGIISGVAHGGQFPVYN